MDSITRRKIIVEELKQNGTVNTMDLAGRLEVTPMTIRRDLAKIAKEGLIKVEYGGAVLNDEPFVEDNIPTKLEKNQKEKVKIAEYCAGMIRDGESVYLDAGTTAAEIARFLQNRKDITVITHSLLAANILSKSEGPAVIMMPGLFRETSMAFMGQLTDEYITRFRINKFFLAVEGVTADELTVPDIVDGATKKALAERAEEIICVADSSKFGKRTFFRICDPRDVSAIVTDTGVEEQELAEFRSAGIMVIQV